ncbi:MAG: ABC transporter permease [Blastocatellia bacterium]|nr:ABC transporter permease [Blastocatellia bacterium]
MKFRRMRAVARKEFIHVLRDPRSLLMALALPLILLLLFGYALTLDVDRIQTLIYDQDRSPESRALIEAFEGSRYFEVTGLVSDYRTIEEKIDRNECLLAIIIPHSYSRNLLSGEQVSIQLILDGSDSNTASIAKGYAEGLVEAYALELRSRAMNQAVGGRVAPPVEARLRVWYNSELQSKNYIVPGLIAVILMIIAALLTSLTIAREWETGTMEQLISTPVRPSELILGKMAAFFAIGLADLAIAIGVGLLIFRVPFRGNALFLVVTSCIFLFGALMWGIFISAVARSQLLAYQMSLVSSFLPAFLLSGFIYSIENMPVVIQVITHIVPARYFVTILKGIFLKGIGPEVLWSEVGFLILYAGVIGAVAARKLRQKLA